MKASVRQTVSCFALCDNGLRESQQRNEYKWHWHIAKEREAVKAKMHSTNTRYKHWLLIWEDTTICGYNTKRQEANRIGHLRCSFL